MAAASSQRLRDQGASSRRTLVTRAEVLAPAAAGQSQACAHLVGAGKWLGVSIRAARSPKRARAPGRKPILADPRYRHASVSAPRRLGQDEGSLWACRDQPSTRVCASSCRSAEMSSSVHAPAMPPPRGRRWRRPDAGLRGADSSSRDRGRPRCACARQRKTARLRLRARRRPRQVSSAAGYSPMRISPAITAMVAGTAPRRAPRPLRTGAAVCRVLRE